MPPYDPHQGPGAPPPPGSPLLGQGEPTPWERRAQLGFFAALWETWRRSMFALPVLLFCCCGGLMFVMVFGMFAAFRP